MISWNFHHLIRIPAIMKNQWRLVSTLIQLFDLIDKLFPKTWWTNYLCLKQKIHEFELMKYLDFFSCTLSLNLGSSCGWIFNYSVFETSQYIIVWFLFKTDKIAISFKLIRCWDWWRFFFVICSITLKKVWIKWVDLTEIYSCGRTRHETKNVKKFWNISRKTWPVWK